MNLVADIGNTAIKVALFEGGVMRFSSRFRSFAEMSVFLAGSEYRFNMTIVSSVRTIPGKVLNQLGRKSDYIHLLSHTSRFPFEIDYETPWSVGMDRLAGAAGAYARNAGGNFLIIDAGTAITYDILSLGSYRGGAISPGIDMRFRALNSFTGRLPLVERSEEAHFPGRSTHHCINGGVVNGIVFEINEYIRGFKKNFSDPEIILTGGDAPFLSGRIAERHITDAYLLLAGLNFILEYNAQKP